MGRARDLLAIRADLLMALPPFASSCSHSRRLALNDCVFSFRRADNHRLRVAGRPVVVSHLIAVGKAAPIWCRLRDWILHDAPFSFVLFSIFFLVSFLYTASSLLGVLLTRRVSFWKMAIAHVLTTPPFSLCLICNVGHRLKDPCRLKKRWIPPEVKQRNAQRLDTLLTWLAKPLNSPVHFVDGSRELIKSLFLTFF